MITVLIAGTLLIPNSAFAEIGKIAPDGNVSPNPSGLKNTGVNESPPNYPPGLEKAGFTRVISSVTSDTDISDISQKGCTVINRLDHGTSFFCPSELVDTLNDVRPVKMYQIQDLFQSQQIQADLVWDQGYDGSRTGVSFPVTVAILDTGVQSDHDELENDIFTTRDFTGEGGDYLDYNGHGTHVTGIVTADGIYNIQDTNNKATGVAPGAEVIVGKICKSGGCPEDAIIAGIEWATSQGAEVINMSIGGGLSYDENCDNDGDNTVDAVNQAVSQGVVVVIASGNDGNKDAVSYPGCASGAIAVGAVDINDNVASFSNAGPALDIVAPGVDTLSSWSCNASLFLSCADTWYYQASGTSMATPHVAGVVALMLDKSPDLTVSEVKEAIYSTALDVGQYDSNGRVDAYAAVNYESTAVEDTTDPVITANTISNPFELTLSDQYEEYCTATDDDPNYEGNCRVLVGGIDTSITGSQSVTYTADPDPSGNTPTDIIVSTTIQDTTSPVISLVGEAIMDLVVNVDSYAEYGANVTDNNKYTMSNADVGGDMVDTTIIGTYTVQYTASDPDGNSADMVTRTVNVVAGDVPVITILGNNPESVIVGDTYDDEGATANDTEDGDLTALINTTSDVNTEFVGNYTVTYEVTDSSGNSSIESRTVSVVEDNPPELTIIGDNPMALELNIDTYFEEGATAIDVEDGDISANISTTGSVNASAIGTYLINYEVTDSFGNTVSDFRTVDVVDTTPPVITINGDNPMSLTVGDDYIEQGATVTDNDLATPEATIGGDNVDTSTAGTYVVTYYVSDPSGNTDNASRTVNVSEAPATLHIADMISETSGKKNWNAKVTITIHGNNHNLVEGAFVQGTWYDENNTPISSEDCTTDSIGQCQVTESTKGTSLTFTVIDVSASGFESYNPDDNEVSDSITVTNDGGSGGDGGGGPDCTKKPDHPKCETK